MDDKKIAVLIDAENVSGKYIKLILDEVSNYGSATLRQSWTADRVEKTGAGGLSLAHDKKSRRNSNGEIT